MKTDIELFHSISNFVNDYMHFLKELALLVYLTFFFKRILMLFRDSVFHNHI